MIKVFRALFLCQSGRSAEMRQCRRQTILIMKYTTEFNSLLDSMPDGYAGHGNPTFLIHSPQFSNTISDKYPGQIAKRVVDFAKTHNINLMPEE